MNNILIVRNEPNYIFDSIDLHKNLAPKDTTIIPCTYDDFSCDISPESQKVFFRNQLLDVSGVYFRTYTNHFFLASTLALYCERNQIPFINSSTTSRLSNGKLFQALAFVYAGMNVPRTIFFHRSRVLEAESRRYIEENLQYPMIVKSISGAEGKDNHLAKSWGDVEEIMKKSDEKVQFIFQEYIPNECDYRLLTLNNTVKMAYKRIRNDDTSHLNNVSQGARTEPVEIAKIPKLVHLAEVASKVMKKEVCGVDIMISSATGKPYVIEANSSPSLAIPGAIEEGLKYLYSLGKKTPVSIPSAAQDSVHTYASKIEAYFQEHSHLLGETYSHFLNRLYVWTHKDKYKRLLIQNRIDEKFTSVKHFNRAITQILHQTIQYDMSDPLQAVFYKKYPTVPFISRTLSLTHFGYTVFDKDFKSEVYNTYSDEQLRTLCEKILNDPDALYVFTSKSGTTNILFNYYHFMKNTPHAFDPIILGEKALESLSETTPQKLRSVAYFITHMIIGESQFYSKPLSAESISRYIPLFKKLEDLIATHFFSYTLDIKLEFLVCSRLLGYSTYLEKMIYSEALNSMSPYGDFIVDTYNVNEKTQKKDIKSAEHRNILFILSTLPYIHAPKPSSK